MGWFRQWLSRRNQQLEHISSSIDALGDIVSTSDNGFQKGLRRLSMAQKQQSDMLESLVQESSALKQETAALKFALTERHGLTLTYEQVLQTLDNLTKIELAASNSPNSQNIMIPLITRSISDLLSCCGLEVIVAVGNPYPERACEVAGATEHAYYSPGIVIEILQQGYQTPEGDVVRAAKVIVAAETAAPTIITPFESTDYAN